MRWALLLTLLAACSKPYSGTRHFRFDQDTFAFGNGLQDVYHRDGAGNWVHERREPPPDYSLHCFVVARSARQFFQHARFDPSVPRADDETYRRLVRRVVSVDPQTALPDGERVVIPGYEDLHSFSRDHESLLKGECGGLWQSYFQRGNWRMIYPFHRDGQESEVRRLLAALKDRRPPIVHVVHFAPAVNHAVLVYDAKQHDKGVDFTIYDPNGPETPRVMTYDRDRRTFFFPETNYWPGGPVDVYEIYRSWNY